MSEMDGINRGFVLADESGNLPLKTNLSRCSYSSTFLRGRLLGRGEFRTRTEEKNQVRGGDWSTQPRAALLHSL